MALRCARPAGRGIRVSDLEAIDLTGWVVDVLTECAWRYDRDGVRVSAARSADARRAIERAQRQTRSQVTPELLEHVASVYRANINGAPTQAVADALGKSLRQAARYVDEARAAALLPPTTQGKRRA